MGFPDLQEYINDPTGRHAQDHEWQMNVAWPPNTVGRRGRITLSGMFTYGELSHRAPFDEIWDGRHWLPQTRDDGTGRDIFGKISPFRHLTPFDRESVMMYPPRHSNRQQPITRFKHAAGPAYYQLIRKSTLSFTHCAAVGVFAIRYLC